jgi:hypothetical protein
LCTCDLEDLIIECKKESDEECSTIIAFNSVEFDGLENIIIYNKTNWFIFRREILGRHHKNDPTYFIDECSKYFTDLYFHPHNKEVVGDYLEKSAIKIIKYLSALNDHFRDYKEKNPGLNTNDMLANFSRFFEMDDTGSLQANSSKKSDLTYEFETNKGGQRFVKEVVCEPHLKIIYPDNPSDPERNKYCARIYFHFGNPEVQSGKILIGSIGPHV